MHAIYWASKDIYIYYSYLLYAVGRIFWRAHRWRESMADSEFVIKMHSCTDVFFGDVWDGSANLCIAATTVSKLPVQARKYVSVPS